MSDYQTSHIKTYGGEGGVCSLLMTVDVAQLVADALEIVNPDDANQEDLARALAADLKWEIQKCRR